MRNLSRLVKGLIENAAKNFAVHNHIWSTPWSAPVVVTQNTSSGVIVHQKKAEIQFCSECSAIRYNDNEFVKTDEPNIYGEK